MITWGRFGRRFPRGYKAVFIVMHYLIGKRRVVQNQRELEAAMKLSRRWDVVHVVTDVIPRPANTRQRRRHA